MYDVIVVGAGIGGTGVAGLLARKGLNVLLLERNKFVGGRCVSHERDGFKIPTYVHAFARVDRGPCGHLADALDVHLDWVREKEATFVIKGKKIPIPLRAGKDALKALGSLKVGWRDLFKASGMAKDIGGNKELWEKKYDGVDIMSWLNRHTKNESILSLIGFISAATFVLPPWEGSTGEYLHILRGMARAGYVGYPMDECSSIPEAYLRSFEAAGGEYKRGTVKKIKVENNRVTGVELADGEFIEARSVISNAGVKTTTLELIDSECFKPDHLERVKKLTGSWSAMVIKVALDKPITDLPACIYMPTLDPVGYFKDLQAGKIPEKMTLWVTIPSTLCPKLAPEGKQLICAGSLLPFKSDRDWEPYIETGFRTLEGLFPDIPRHTMWKDSVTPAQVEKWTGPRGPVFEVSQTLGQVGKDRPPIDSSIDGLYFVGADVGKRAVGVELAASSAFLCADMVEEKIKQR